MNDCEHEWRDLEDIHPMETPIRMCHKCATIAFIPCLPAEFIEVKFIIEPPKPKAVLLWKELKMWVTNHPRPRANATVAPVEP